MGERELDRKSAMEHTAGERPQRGPNRTSDPVQVTLQADASYAYNIGRSWPNCMSYNYEQTVLIKRQLACGISRTPPLAGRGFRADRTGKRRRLRPQAQLSGARVVALARSERR